VRLNLRHDDAARSLRELKQRNADLLAAAPAAAPSLSPPTVVGDCTNELLAREAALNSQPPDDWA